MKLPLTLNLRKYSYLADNTVIGAGSVVANDIHLEHQTPVPMQDNS